MALAGPGAVAISWITEASTKTIVSISCMGSAAKTVSGPAPTQYSFQSAYIAELYTSGWIHHAVVPNLHADTSYTYKVGNGASSGWSKPYTFSTPPATGPEVPFRFGIMGDLGQTGNSSITTQHVIDGKYHVALLVGDLSYADSAWKPGFFGPCTQKRWDSWGKMVEPLAATTPLMVLPGNHEVEQDGALPATQTQFLAYQKRMRMPSAESGADEGNLYYSFEVGSVHFIMLNSYSPFNSTSPQFHWLVKDLETVDRKVTPWLVVGMHAPWYNSNKKHHDESAEVDMRQAMEPLFLKAKVDLVLAGHVHAYERMYNVANNVTSPDGPVYINIGDAGNREGPCPDYYAQPSWSAFRESRFGHGEMQVFNSTHMEWTWHRVIDNEAVDADHVLLVKDGNQRVEAKGSGVSASQYDGYAHLRK